MLARFTLIAACLALAVPADQDPAPVRDSDALYPAARVEEVVRFLVVKTDEPDVGEMTAALRDLGARIVYGPRTTEARPGRAIFAVQAPVDIKAKELERAARKAGGVADELSVVAFDGRDDRDTRVIVGGLSFNSRDFVLGMSGEIVWFDSVGGWSQFYGEPGKLTAEELADRYLKLYQPYGGGRLGELVRERFTWNLADTPDEKAAQKLLKAVEKLDGVSAATLEGAELTVTVALEDLVACSPVGTVPAPPVPGGRLDPAEEQTPRAAFDTRLLWDLLEKEGLAPLAAGEGK